jgi:hypothetical protein
VDSRGRPARPKLRVGIVKTDRWRPVNFNYSSGRQRPFEIQPVESRWGSQTLASWNLICGWLARLDRLRLRRAIFEALVLEVGVARERPPGSSRIDFMVSFNGRE